MKLSTELQSVVERALREAGDRQHEFSTVQNVIEDVVDIISNIKGLVFKSDSSESKTVSIQFKGKGII